MTNKQTISWIFLATALATQKEAADTKGISEIADGINHAIPTENELRTSLQWLIETEWIKKTTEKYSLTKKGMINYNYATLKTNILLDIWRDIERMMK